MCCKDRQFWSYHRQFQKIYHSSEQKYLEESAYFKHILNKPMSAKVKLSEPITKNIYDKCRLLNPNRYCNLICLQYSDGFHIFRSLIIRSQIIASFWFLRFSCLIFLSNRKHTLLPSSSKPTPFDALVRHVFSSLICQFSTGYITCTRLIEELNIYLFATENGLTVLLN